MVSYPPFLIPLALVFWGWRGDAPLAAGLLLLAVGLVRFSPWRWLLDRAQYHRIGDLTAVLFLGMAGYLIVGRGDHPPVYELLRWLPALLCPLLLAQLYGTGTGLPLSALFYSLRRRSDERAPPNLDFRLPYAFACLLAAGSGQAGDSGYFAGVAALLLWCLWRNQPRRQAAPAWLGLFLLAAALGYGGQIGLIRLQVLVEQWSMDWLMSRTEEADPYRARTAIGDVGRLKLSGRVVMRVAADHLPEQRLLLKEAAYDRYAGQSWVASRPGFTPYSPPAGDAPRQLEVLRIESGRSVLVAVPAGLRGLILPPRAGYLTANRLGAIEWQDAPPVLRYRIAYDPEAPDTAPSTPADLEIPGVTAKMLQPLVGELALTGLPPHRAVSTVGDFFARNFNYSLDLGDKDNSMAALSDFLYRRRSGHCEYFATATALLLRAAGVPARFVGGYAVEEYDALERVYLVRSRHAHAWTEAWLGGAWRVVDNTPSDWAVREAEADPWWQGMADRWSGWMAALRVWQWERAQQEEKGGFPPWGWLVLPLSLWLGWRLYRSRQKAPLSPSETAAAMWTTPVDPEYGRLERSLVRAGHPPRGPSEPPLLWLRRIGRTEFERDVIAYYRRRYRDGDAGLGAGVREPDPSNGGAKQ
jgi:transglutaminase-like putative cysteine protease